MSQAFSYPSSSTVTVSAIGPNGQPIPNTSILVAGETPAGNLAPIQTDTNGNLIVTTASGPAATEATLQLVDADIKAMSAKLPATLGAKTSANSLSITLATDTASLPVTGPLTDTQLRASAVPVSLAASPLPTGAATAANQTTELTRLSGALVPTAYNEIDLTYITTGNGIGQVGTAVYKLATATVKTLTLTYDASNRLSTVVAS